MQQYKSDIERYYFEDNHEKFFKELQGFIGFVTREYCPGFKQTSQLYEQYRNDVIQEIYGFLREKRFSDQFTIIIDKKGRNRRKYLKGNIYTHYEKTVIRVKEEYNRDLDFSSFLYTQIRGEMTKFMYYFNIRRKTEVVLNFKESKSKDKQSLLKVYLEDIIKELGMKIEDNLEDIINYFQNNLSYDLNSFNFKNIYQIKVLMWKLYLQNTTKEQK